MEHSHLALILRSAQRVTRHTCNFECGIEPQHETTGEQTCTNEKCNDCHQNKQSANNVETDCDVASHPRNLGFHSVGQVFQLGFNATNLTFYILPEIINCAELVRQVKLTQNVIEDLILRLFNISNGIGHCLKLLFYFWDKIANFVDKAIYTRKIQIPWLNRWFYTRDRILKRKYLDFYLNILV